MINSINTTALKELMLVFGGATLIMLVVPKFIALGPISYQVLVWLVYLLAMLVIWKLQQTTEGWKLLGLGPIQNKLRFIWKSIIVALVALIAFVLIGAIAYKMGLITEEADYSGYEHLKGNWWLLFVTLIAVYIGSSFGEEVVFRGFLISRLLKIFDGPQAAVWSILLSGVIFGCAHVAWGPLGMLQTTAMGWALGYFYVRYQRQLWINIVAHAILDTLLLIQMV